MSATIDIRKDPAAIEAINAILNSKGIAEIKTERGNLAVVEIRRTLKTAKDHKQ